MINTKLLSVFLWHCSWESIELLVLEYMLMKIEVYFALSAFAFLLFATCVKTQGVVFWLEATIYISVSKTSARHES